MTNAVTTSHQSDRNFRGLTTIPIRLLIRTTDAAKPTNDGTEVSGPSRATVGYAVADHANHNFQVNATKAITKAAHQRGKGQLGSV